MQATCPECAADLDLPGALVGEIVPCPDCGAELEFVRIVYERSGIYRHPEPRLLAGTNLADVGWNLDPLASPGSLDDIKAVVGLGLHARILTHIRCHKEDAAVALDTGVDGVDVVIGTSSQLRQLGHGKSIDEIIDLAAEVRRFAAEQGIAHFFEVGRGICHQVLSAETLVLPGQLILGADSHTTRFGWLGAFGAGVGRSEMAAIWATGELWLRVPETIRIELVGERVITRRASQRIAHIACQQARLRAAGGRWRNPRPIYQSTDLPINCHHRPQSQRPQAERRPVSGDVPGGGAAVPRRRGQ